MLTKATHAVVLQNLFLLSLSRNCEYFTHGASAWSSVIENPLFTIFAFFAAVPSTFGRSLEPLNLSLNLSTFSVGRSLSFSFRTRGENGTILLLGSKTADYVSVKLKNGSILFAVNLGNGKCLVVCKHFFLVHKL